MAETFYFGTLGGQDINVGYGQFTATLPDGSIGTLDKVGIQTLLGTAVVSANDFAGADSAAKINAACVVLAAVSPAGGTIDARSLKGNQTFASDMFSGVSIPVRLLVGESTYQISAAQVLPAGSEIIGSSRDASVFKWTGAVNGTMISVTSNQCRISNINCTTGQGGTTVGVSITGGNCHLDNMYFGGTTETSGFAYPIKVTTGSSTTKITNVWMYSFIVAGIYTNNTTDVFISNTSIFSIPDGTTAIGLLIDTDTSGLYATDVSIGYGKNGVKIQHSLTGTQPRFLSFQNVLADTTSGGDAWLFASDLSTGFVEARLTNCWGAGAGRSAANAQVTAGASGFRISGGQIINLVNCNSRSNDRDGLKIDSANVRYITVGHSSFTENNQSLNAAGNGIYLTAAAQDVQILGNRFANYPSGNMRYGVRVDAVAADNLMISGNDFVSLTTGSVLNGNTARTIIGPNSPRDVLANSFTMDQALARSRTVVAADSPVSATGTDTLILCDCTAGAITVNLPAVATYPNHVFVIKKIDGSGNAVTVSAADTIDSAATKSLATVNEAIIVSNNGAGGAYYIWGQV